MNTLIIDNYDSFTYNLFQLAHEIPGIVPKVVFNDELSLEEIIQLAPQQIILSPGPGHPGKIEDFGVCGELIAYGKIPLLGVCLGHQGMIECTGGTVDYAPEPMHGRVSQIHHYHSPMFAGIPQGFSAVRYHSLIAKFPLPPGWEVSAWTDSGDIMGIYHTQLPFWGVQYHPESIGTAYGRQLLLNFFQFAQSFPTLSPPSTDSSSIASPSLPTSDPLQRPLLLHTEKVACPWEPQQIFHTLFADHSHAYWLDGAYAGAKEGQNVFSYMGAYEGLPHEQLITYEVASQTVSIQEGERTQQPSVDFFDYLHQWLTERTFPPTDSLPFAFQMGPVGYLGYEMKALSGVATPFSSPLPDAAFIFSTRMIAIDHEKGELWLCALTDPRNREEAHAWFEKIKHQLAAASPPLFTPQTPTHASTSLHWNFERSQAQYLQDIQTCREAIIEGESYEICLTNMIFGQHGASPLEVYLKLREVNPAPYAAYFQMGETGIASSSPELFLHIDAKGQVITKPIKGTISRGAHSYQDQENKRLLSHSEKDRAENLMIVDLLRNDLGKICTPGSISVPALNQIESFATVHQLVSTVRGQLPASASVLEVIRAAFPGGSITGAPKLRTMEILNQLEKSARGVYTGAIGYLSLTGTACFNIAIRTLEIGPTTFRMGTGGAITLLSDPQKEWEELLVKAAPLIHTLETLHKNNKETIPETMRNFK